MRKFEEVFHPSSGVDADLLPVLSTLYHELQRERPDLPSLRSALIGVLEFLASSRGRTDANCSAVDTFLMRQEVWDGDRFPESYVDVLADMAGALHDTVSAPDIAHDFDSTPEQLLERAKRL